MIGVFNLVVDIKDCDMNNDYFHFTNKKNIDSILNNGLIPSIGTASQLVNDRPNVSVSKGGKGIMGIINSFIYKFSNELKVCDIPEEFKKYFEEISNFQNNNMIGADIACKAMIRKLKDEVYFRVRLEDKQIEDAKIGGLTGFDVNLPMAIDKSNLDIVVGSDNKILTAYDVAKNVYERAKNIDVFRNMHPGFFYMFEGKSHRKSTDRKVDDFER